MYGFAAVGSGSGSADPAASRRAFDGSALSLRAEAAVPASASSAACSPLCAAAALDFLCLKPSAPIATLPTQTQGHQLVRQERAAAFAVLALRAAGFSAVLAHVLDTLAVTELAASCADCCHSLWQQWLFPPCLVTLSGQQG